MLYPLSYRPKRGLADTSEEPQTCTVVKAGVRDRFFWGRIVRRFRCRLGKPGMQKQCRLCQTDSA